MNFKQIAQSVLSFGLIVAAAVTVPSLSPVRAQSAQLQDYGPAPEIAGIEKWLNSDPLTLASLKGKVVLVDFWTYSCINCIRTLPHVVSWYDKYKDQGLVVIGVHAPEFPQERSTSNVKTALERFGIKYPVAQDNKFATWNAFDNKYWPSIYLIDRSGKIVLKHAGEGQYAETEDAIRTLLNTPAG